ncbi:membrane hypothetical protein [Candidatus Terasakiella magnetica]|uniref:TrbL/VirB6 plasmid conjugal transfer protein n=1 Tax=Candidatus Terasakiella magnetica TaxID=1867952 RepID=A0A1C3RLG4_9PROT|nr:hypothetical protein [Candidatus Terasakiella magnetica]SCA58142.1 membrane hypothetical protein [Candidatus Terasakiella magnetica]
MSIFDDALDWFGDTANSAGNAIGGALPEYELTGNLTQAYASIMKKLAPTFYMWIGNEVANVIWAGFFMLAVIVYVFNRLTNQKFTRDTVIGAVSFMTLLAMNSAIGPWLWPAVQILIDYCVWISKSLIIEAAYLIGIPLEAISNVEREPIADLTALLDAQVGNLSDLGFALIDKQTLWTMVSSAKASASSYVFGFFISFIFGLVSFFYFFLVVRSHAYVMFVFILSPLIIPCAGPKFTRPIAKASGKTVMNGLCTIVVPSFGLSLVVTVLSATKRLTGCIEHFSTEYKTKCKNEIAELTDTFGIQIPEVTTAGGAIDFYLLVIGVGLLSILLMFVGARTVSQIVGGPSDASPIAIIAATMAAAKTAGMTVKGSKLAGRGTMAVGGQLGSLGKNTSGAVINLGKGIGSKFGGG